MKKFVRGTLMLAECVDDVEAYVDKHRAFLEGIVSWSEKVDIYVLFGASEDNSYLCEYVITGNTIKYCKGVFAELKQMLKPVFPKIQSLFQASGDKY